MAPNLRQLSLLSEDALADMSALVRAKVMVSPAETQHHTATASYWDWPAEVPLTEPDLFSVEHVEGNLIQGARSWSSAEAPSSMVAEHDDYWNESLSLSASERPVMKALHTQVDVQDADVYWAETSHSSTVSDTYWASVSPQSATRHDRDSLNGHGYTEYWDEPHYDTPSVSDNYWYNESSNERSYWDERSSALSASDRYWSMAVL